MSQSGPNLTFKGHQLIFQKMFHFPSADRSIPGRLRSNNSAARERKKKISAIGPKAHADCRKQASKASKASKASNASKASKSGKPRTKTNLLNRQIPPPDRSLECAPLRRTTPSLRVFQQTNQMLSI